MYAERYGTAQDGLGRADCDPDCDPNSASLPPTGAGKSARRRSWVRPLLGDADDSGDVGDVGECAGMYLEPLAEGRSKRLITRTLKAVIWGLLREMSGT